MQLARNLFLSPDRNFRRKMQEVMLSIQIERRFTKPQIFTLYANQIYLGHGVYGFEAGANFYFSKKAKDLTLEEAAVLAGLPKAPNYYSPINNPERAMRRRNLVINNMLEDGKITAAEAQRAKPSYRSRRQRVAQGIGWSGRLGRDYGGSLRRCLLLCASLGRLRDPRGGGPADADRQHAHERYQGESALVQVENAACDHLLGERKGGRRRRTGRGTRDFHFAHRWLKVTLPISSCSKASLF